jgi:sigma-B regulation protein RsbU (phosphoserine phosphatase)
MPATRERPEETREASMSLFAGVPDDDGARLAFAVEAMRELSSRADPGAMTRAYAARMRRVLPTDRLVFLDRRGLRPPACRVVPSSTRLEGAGPGRGEGNPLVLEGGLLGDLLDGDEPRLVDQLEVAAGDPGAGYLAGQSSLLALSLYDGGVAAEMVVAMRREPAAFRREQLPELVWLANLFGCATRNDGH